MGSSRRSGALGCAIQREQHAAVLDAGFVAMRTAHVGRHGFAAVQVDLPVVQRAGDLLAEDDALRQRTALVRAAVVQGEYLIVGGAEHRDVALGAGDDACAERVDLVQGADVEPGHGDFLEWQAVSVEPRFQAGSIDLSWIVSYSFFSDCSAMAFFQPSPSKLSEYIRR